MSLWLVPSCLGRAGSVLRHAPFLSSFACFSTTVYHKEPHIKDANGRSTYPENLRVESASLRSASRRRSGAATTAPLAWLKARGGAVRVVCAQDRRTENTALGQHCGAQLTLCAIHSFVAASVRPAARFCTYKHFIVHPLPVPRGLLS
eukprot:6183461-Pleurochrysis_carterae.AAC.10